MPIDYDEAYDWAMDFCNPRKDEIAKPILFDGALYATDGRIALQIDEIDCEGIVACVHNQYAELIRDMVRTCKLECDHWRRHMVATDGLYKGLRAVLAGVAECGSLYLCRTFGLSQGSVMVDEGVYISAEYAQMGLSLFGNFDEEDVRIWAGTADKPVMFEGRRWAAIVMPLKAIVGPCADMQSGQIVTAPGAADAL
jgi:hypothetical protein